MARLPCTASLAGRAAHRFDSGLWAFSPAVIQHDRSPFPSGDAPSWTARRHRMHPAFRSGMASKASRSNHKGGVLTATAQRLVPEQEVEAEIKVKNSRFIGSISPTPSVEAAREYIASLKQRYPDGRHHCYAFSIGHGSSVIQGMSDDGEPSGTAGRPMLAVLSGSGLGDCTVVVTRYFGGTKLGTGGLVKAYTEATQAALLEASVVEKVEKVLIGVDGLDYQFYSKIKGPIEAMTATIEEEQFTDDISLVISVEDSRAEDVKSFIQEATSGQARIEDV